MSWELTIVNAQDRRKPLGQRADVIVIAATLVFKLLGNNTGDINRRALIAYDRFVFPVSRLIDRFSSRWIGKNLVALARRG